jgi:hypothetical protein
LPTATHDLLHLQRSHQRKQKKLFSYNTMITKTTEETTALILAGDGYSLTIAPEAEHRKADLLLQAATVTEVTSNDESADAQVISRRLAAMRIEVEKSRKAVKEPVNRIGKLIDSTANNFIAAIEGEEKRITRIVGDHAEEMARVKREKERAEAQAFAEARAAREAAEAAMDAAETTGRISDILAAKQAERERLAAAAQRMMASDDLASTKVADGVRFAWDFDVTDINILYLRDRSLIEMTPRRAAILALIRGCAESGRDPVDVFAALGIHAYQKPVVSSR